MSARFGFGGEYTIGTPVVKFFATDPDSGIHAAHQNETHAGSNETRRQASAQRRSVPNFYS